MHSTDYSSSNYESVNNSIRAKSKLGFLENLNAKLAEQRLSGKAFAVRSIINSKALVSWFKSTQFNFFLNSYFSTGKNGIYFGVHINIFIYCFCLHIVLVEIDRIFFYCSFSHFLSFEIIVWYAIKINKISRYKNSACTIFRKELKVAEVKYQWQIQITIQIVMRWEKIQHTNRN